MGAILQTAAQNIEMLFVGRVIGGIASGLVFGVCPMFMSEISPASFRGRVGGLYNLNINLGYARESSKIESFLNRDTDRGQSRNGWVWASATSAQMSPGDSS